MKRDNGSMAEPADVKDLAIFAWLLPASISKDSADLVNIVRSSAAAYLKKSLSNARGTASKSKSSSSKDDAATRAMNMFTRKRFFSS